MIKSKIKYIRSKKKNKNIKHIIWLRFIKHNNQTKSLQYFYFNKIEKIKNVKNKKIEKVSHRRC